MTVYAIGDLHLPAEQKPMDVFGPHWIDHFQRISEDWRARVSDEDVVLIPGDITWAMQLDAARPDLNAIGALPGRKIITRGNHDFWWSAIGRVRDALPEGMYALQNDGMALDGVHARLDAGHGFGRRPRRSEDLSAGADAAGNVAEVRKTPVGDDAAGGDDALSAADG